MLREMSGINRSVIDTCEDKVKKDSVDMILHEEKVTVIEAKTNVAADYESRIGSHGVDTETLIETLVSIVDEVTKDSDDIALAGFSEACISVLLKHLDTSGVSKTSLEDVVNSR